MTAMINAMRVLTDPAETGAVTVALPQDVQGEAYDYPEEFLARRVHHIERRAPTEAQVKRAANMIRASKRPYVICGGGVRYSGAGAELAAFCARYHVPFGETQAGKGTILWDDPHNLAGIGAPAASPPIGSRKRRTSSSPSVRGSAISLPAPSGSSRAKPAFLGINVAAFDAYKMNAEPIVADAKLAISAIDRALAATGYRWWGVSRRAGARDDGRPKWIAFTRRKYRADSRRCGPSASSTTDPSGERDPRIGPRARFRATCSGSGARALRAATTWSTASPAWATRSPPPSGRRSPNPTGKSWALVGDGAYTMLHSELLTAIQEGRKIIVVVLDNSGFQCIDNLQRSQGITSFGNEWGRDPGTGRLTGPRSRSTSRRTGRARAQRGIRARAWTSCGRR